MTNNRKTPAPLQVAMVLWLSFLLAIAPTGIVFSLFDPNAVSACLTVPEVSPLAAYSIGFFAFWLLCAGAGLLCVYFLSGGE
ncbi:MAG: hypothetical protein OXF58_08945 [Gammaproteobacteria bacterium]|nr:hypothetical protein [Gammaproteobacteria bacterium]